MARWFRGDVEMKFLKNILTQKYKLKTASYKKFQKQKITISPKGDSNESVAIITKPQTNFFAHVMAYYFAKNNIKSVISPYDFETSDPKIIFCPQTYDDLPDGYIGYQTEQTTNDRFFQPHHKDILKKSSILVDYASDNIKNLQPICPDTDFHHLPVTYCNDFVHHLMQNNLITQNDLYDDRPYDVVFYGDPRNERRQAYLKELEKHSKIKIICGVFGMDVVRELLKAKIIVNIHYFDDAILEIGRIYEAMSLGCHVVSEKAIDQHHHGNLEPFVDFCDIDDISQIVEAVKHALENPQQNAKQDLKKLSAIMDENFDLFLKSFMNKAKK